MTKAKNIAAYAAVAAASPYLVLKIMWLSGSTIGTNASTPDDATFYAMNLFTVLMDATAVLLALAFTRRWGRRLPAPLILFPMWVGIGFLGAIVLALPAAAAISALRGVNVFAEGGGIVEPWVYAVVYVGFVSQGVGLLTAFVLYARERWPRLPGGPLPSELGLLAKSMVGMQALLGLICLYWGLGGDAGLPAGSTSFSGRFPAGRVRAVVRGGRVRPASPTARSHVAGPHVGLGGRGDQLRVGAVADAQPRDRLAVVRRGSAARAARTRLVAAPARGHGGRPDRRDAARPAEPLVRERAGTTPRRRRAGPATPGASDSRG
ncbi:MAG: hypothetical protein HOU81_13220 [Hamadaea sp.]|nr:hypothetical protein [Hamadaea sp.]